MSPVLCAGIIGYRSYQMINNDARNIGIYGFGAAAHILIQVAIRQGKHIFAFTRRGDIEAQAMAKRLGAEWAGDSSEKPPIQLDAAIIFAPEGTLIPKALSDTDKGAIIVCGGIHMTDIPSFPYHLLWEERMLMSVANLTRNDVTAFLATVADMEIKTETKQFPLERANEALDELRNGTLHGAAVITME
jgi:propanol-preferring alcohol dehydrogenase